MWTIAGMNIRASHAVILPGTGSDDRFAADAFEPALRDADISVQAVRPDPSSVVAGYVAALDDAARIHGRILLGGISIGAAVAAAWALDNPESTAGIMAALPPWLGEPEDAPAALSARFTAAQLTEHGLTAVIDAMSASTPPWLATTLTRSWTEQWPELPAALMEASRYTAPDPARLRRLDAPVAIVASVDDPVHPLEIAETWHAEIERSTLATVTLSDIGDDPAVLGRLAVSGLRALTV